jgi:hypothetical protein
VGKKQPAEYRIDEDDVKETPLDNYFLWVDEREMFECANVFLTKSLNLIYQTIWLIPILWTWKISKNNRTQMMPCCNMQLNTRTNMRVSALAQLIMSYAILSQEILQTIGELHYQKAYYNQQLSGSTK